MAIRVMILACAALASAALLFGLRDLHYKVQGVRMMTEETMVDLVHAKAELDEANKKIDALLRATEKK